MKSAPPREPSRISPGSRVRKFTMEPAANLRVCVRYPET
jgi:hypothetical protein